MIKNPLLKNANGFDTPAGNPKKHYDGFYPEAIGGGWNPSDGEDMSNEYSKQVGGYLKTQKAPDKVENFIEGLYRGTQEPPAPKGKKQPNSVKMVSAGVRRSKMANVNIQECDYCHTPYQFDPESPNRGSGLCSECSDFSDELRVDEAQYQQEKADAELAQVEADMAAEAAPKKIRTPRFNKEDKIRLHGLGIKASVKTAWDKAVSDGVLQFSNNRYSFNKDASDKLVTGLKPLVATVNRKLNRLHVPKRAAAHEAAVKEIAQRVVATDQKFNRIAAFAEALTAAKKQKCPHCGSTEYALMPTDFETAKCDKCGKNWEHGIVKGVNDPSDSKTAFVTNVARMKSIHTAATTKKKKKAGYMSERELAAYHDEQMQKLKDGHELNTRLDDHLEVKTCPGCGEDFYANRNDGDYCCYEHSDGHWHGAPEGAGAESVTASKKTAWEEEDDAEDRSFEDDDFEDEDYDEYNFQTQTLPAGTVLYHGTDSKVWNPRKETIESPAWFSQYREVAEWFSTWHDDSATKSTPVIAEYRTTKPIDLVVINSAQDIKNLCEKYGVFEGGAREMAEELTPHIDGWIIPNNYTNGDDIMFTDASIVEFVKLEKMTKKKSSLTAITAAVPYTKKAGHHCARTECSNCGSVQNCRCSSKKETKVVDACGACEGKTASKTAGVYQVVKDGQWYIKGLPSENYDGGTDADSMIHPGMYHGMDTPESIAEGLYVALYDELQTNDNLKDGDIFETQVGQFIVKGIHVVPHDEKAKAVIAAVNEQYKCVTCGCDKADHPGGENCMKHPECTYYKSRSDDGI